MGVLKSAIYVLSIFFATAAESQTLNIDSMVTHSSGSELWLYGNFGTAQGFVKLEGNALPIQLWSPDSIICSLLQPTSGRVVVGVSNRLGSERILENITITSQRLWGVMGPGEGYEGNRGIEFFDTLNYSFDATKASSGMLAVSAYHSIEAWSYWTKSEYTMPGMNGCGSYSANGSGSDSAEDILTINRGNGNLLLSSIQKHYSYAATYCRWDTMGSATNTGSDSGKGVLSPLGANFTFDLVDNNLVNVTTIYDNGAPSADFTNRYFDTCASDNTHGSFFFASTNAGGKNEITNYSIGYPFPKVLGVRSNQTDQMVSIFPNPANTKIWLLGGDIIGLYDLNGNRLTIEISKTQDGYMLNVQKLACGIYELICVEKQDIISIPLIIAR